jgi:hypothetical protein
MDIENPLQADVLHVIEIEMPNAKEIPTTCAIPIAKCVGRESNGRESNGRESNVSESTEERDSTTTEKIFGVSKKICFLLEISAIVFVGLAFLGGFILFLVWLCNPTVFGSTPEIY